MWVMSKTMTKTMTESDVLLWVGICGDMNPVHIDRVYGKTTRFKDVVVPGLCVAGLISTAVTKVTFGNVYAMQTLKFVKTGFYWRYHNGFGQDYR